MKIAILVSNMSTSTFSSIWIDYCKRNNYVFGVFSPYDTDIVEKVSSYDIILFHHHQSEFADTLLAKSLLYSLQSSGKIVFPDFNTGWHFDDKLGQKYLFESLCIDYAKAYVFYDQESALKWISTTTFPKVFKLRGGASSNNVMLAKNVDSAKAYVKRAFGSGFKQYRGFNHVKEQWLQYQNGRASFFELIRSFGRLIIPNKFTRLKGREKGYVYFQEFIPNEGYDIRATIIGDRAILFSRKTRHNDFRASGSGFIECYNENIDKAIVEFAFNVAKTIRSQSVAIDIVIDKTSNKPFVIEISYGFVFPKIGGYSINNGPTGYWNSDLVFVREPKFCTVEWMLEGCIATYNKRQNETT